MLSMNKKILIISTVIANVVYLLWRVCFTIPMDTSRISLFLAWGLFLAELLGVFELCVYLYGASHVKIPQLPKVQEEQFPEVDVFIATYNEPVELLRKTVIGCKNMKYPDKNFVHVYLCDDGNRTEMERLAEELGIYYLKREENHGAKAGNLNHALKHSKSDLIATFDADMIPTERFLMETVPYFLEKGKKIGFVQTPQAFYNADLFQSKLYSERRIPNEQDYFYRNVQMTKNYTNTVIYGGSNTVISRKALEEVGGFFEQSITEDFATGILIQSKGYECLATNKPLASGLSPNDFKSLVKQRERWARGCIQSIRRLNILRSKHLTWKQKISHASAIAYWYAPMKRFFYISAPIAFTVFGIYVIHASFHEIMLFFLPTYVLTTIAVQNLSGNIRNPRWTNIYETITFPSLIPSILCETLGISQRKFSVTSKDKNTEYDKKYHFKKAIPFIIYIVFSVIGIANVIMYMPLYSTWNFIVLLFWLVVNLLYLIMALFFILEFQKSNTEIHYYEAVDFEINNGGKKYSATTTEISDYKIIFELEEGDVQEESFIYALFQIETQEKVACKLKLYVKKKQCYKYKAHTKNQCSEEDVPCQVPCQVSCRYLYECKILEMTQEEQDIWNGFLHNRIPTMPQTVSGSRHIWEDLKVNIQARCSRK